MQKGNRVNSERIKEARLFRKMTMADLAESVGINKRAISQFENNKTTPEPLTLHKISEALDFPYSFFLEYDNPSTIGNTYFRALYSSKKKDLVAQKIRAKYLVKIQSVLSSFYSVKSRQLLIELIFFLTAAMFIADTMRKSTIPTVTATAMLPPFICGNMRPSTSR